MRILAIFCALIARPKYRSCPQPSWSAAVIVHCCHSHHPLLWMSTAAMIRRRSHHCHSVSPPSLAAHPCPSPLYSAAQSCMPLSSAAVVVCLHHRCMLPPSSTAAAIITTPLSLPSLTAHSHPSPLQSAAQSRVSLSSATIVIRHHRRPPLPYLHLSSLQQDVDCCIISRAGPPQQIICDGINVS